MRVVFIAICLLVTQISFGQEKERVKEIGLGFSNLDEFGFVYKTGHQKSMWRFNVISLHNSKSDVEQDGLTDNELKNSGFNFSVGKEYYNDLTPKFQFKYGWDIFYGFTKSKQKEIASNLYTDRDKFENKNRYCGVNLVLGVNYPINDHIVLGAEVTPALQWHKSKKEQNDETIYENTGHSFGFSNHNARITLSYRF
jgi:hypothetical protein